MDKIVPLIGSAEVGPLGVLHLPRLWLKVSLDAKGALAEGYPAIGTGFDQMVLDGLGLKKDAVSILLRKTGLPTVSSKPGSKNNRVLDWIRPRLKNSMNQSEVAIMTKPRQNPCSARTNCRRISVFVMQSLLTGSMTGNAFMRRF